MLRSAGLTIGGDHPRARGEQGALRAYARVLAGSSPRTRGAVPLHLLLLAMMRIIPAHAGSSGQGDRIRLGHRDHPRARGEQPKRGDTMKGYTGSSPRTRGAGEELCAHGWAVGIIPAHAGSRTRRRGATARATDHPRARGEQRSRTTRQGRGRGSSPRTRGAVGWRGGAGTQAQDHPRARGEQRCPAGRQGEARGSSPRTRGAGAQSARVRSLTGIIPAHAGSSPQLLEDFAAW